MAVDVFSDSGSKSLSELVLGRLFHQTISMDWKSQSREDLELKTSTSHKSQMGSAGGFTLQFSHLCAACHGHSKSAKREFSDQAWSALVTWGEVSHEAVDQPLCNDCYFNFRDVLIDRAADIAAAANTLITPASRSNMRAVNG